jgi:preprotein translocase subunit SecE
MGEEVGFQKGLWVQLRDYVSDVRAEMKRVTWPGKQEIYGTTVMVLVTTFLFAFYFWICDQTFSQLVGKILKYFLHRT